MRILHVSPFLAPRYGGAPQAALTISRALLQQGVSVVIAGTDADGPHHLHVQLGTPNVYGGVPAIFFRRQWHDGFQYSWPYAQWLRAHVAEFDVVHMHLVFSHPCLAAARACRSNGVPYVVCPEGTLDPWSLRQRRLRKQLLWRLEGEHMLRRAAAIHYATVEERRRAEDSLGLTRGAVIPLIVSEDVLHAPPLAGRFRAQYPALARNPYVLVLCRLHPKKALELLLDVFLDVTSDPEFGCWRLVIAGEGSEAYARKLRRLVADRRGAERVLFTGWLGGEDRIAALQGAGLLALTSYQENFGLAAAEALACGVPVLVSTDVNLVPEIRAAGAGWAVALNHSALAATMREALRCDDERARRGAAGKALAANRFSPAAVGSQLLDLYHSVTRGAHNSFV